jgi:hypothetical protein
MTLDDARVLTPYPKSLQLATAFALLSRPAFLLSFSQRLLLDCSGTFVVI